MDLEEIEEAAAREPIRVWEPVEPPRSRSNYWLRTADRRFAKSFGRLLSECGIIASEWAALRELYGPQWWSPMDLGRAIGMSKGGASKLVSRLVRKGLVNKRTAESDRRFRSIGLTQQGRELVVRLAPIEKEADRTFFQPLGSTRRYRLAEWLKRVLDPIRGERMSQWVSQQLQEHHFIRVDPDAGAKAAARAQAQADAFWEFCKQSAEAAALGRPPPNLPSIP